jgi:hypothetical protein
MTAPMELALKKCKGRREGKCRNKRRGRECDRGYWLNKIVNTVAIGHASD